MVVQFIGIYKVHDVGIKSLVTFISIDCY